MKIEQIMLTPTKAQVFINSQVLNRDLCRNSVEKLCMNILNNEWRLNNDAVCLDKDGHLINGQHRCAAVVKTGISVPVILAEGFEKEDIFVIDQTIKPRNISDFLKLNGIENNVAMSAALSNMNTYLCEVYLKKRVHFLSPSAAFIEYKKHCGMQHSLHLIKKTRLKAGIHLFPPTMATFLHYAFSINNSAGADEFFESLSTGSFLSDDAVVLQLRNRFIRNKTEITSLNKRDTMALIIKAWNITMNGRGTKLIWRPSVENFPTIYREPFKGMYSPEKSFGMPE